jgi:hypothetical protein
MFYLILMYAHAPKECISHIRDRRVAREPFLGSNRLCAMGSDISKKITGDWLFLCS